MTEYYEKQNVHLDEKEQNIIMYLEQNHNTDFEKKMLSNNKIKGILKAGIRYVDNQECMVYSTKGFMSLKKVMTSKIKIDEYAIIMDIYDTVKRSKEYFLNQNSFIIEIEKIYVDMGSMKAYICYCPGGNVSNVPIEESIKNVIEEMMVNLDYSDRNKTEKISRMYSMVTNEGFEICMLEKLNNTIKSNLNIKADSLEKVKNIYALENKENIKNQKTDNIYNTVNNIILIPDRLNKYTGQNIEIMVKERIMIGRAEDNDVVIKYNYVSRKHACIYMSGERACIMDLHSTNHTFVNDKEINNDEIKLNNNDIIRLADITFKIKLT